MERETDHKIMGIKEVSVRLTGVPTAISDEPITTPESAVRFMGSWMKDLDRENVCVVNFRSDGTPINYSVCSIGTINGSLVHPREIFKSSILSNSAAIMVLHNHPSGNLQPSAEDINITARLQEAGEIIGIPLKDHIIIGREDRYFSFKENQILSYKTCEYANDISKINFEDTKVAESDVLTKGTEADRRQREIKEMTDKLERGIKDLFDSERYKVYLGTMSKFYNYSVNNCLLIAMQRPDATAVASYTAWERTFGRHVKRGEKGIRILAPAPYKTSRDVKKFDPVTKEPVIDKDGKPVMERKQEIIPAYKAVSVFDVTQTYGKELPNIVSSLVDNVDGYEKFFEALKQASPVPVNLVEIDGSARGFYSLTEKTISVRKGMSQAQTIKTAIHEMAHAVLHDVDAGTEKAKSLDRHTREVQAESVAYVVCQHYGINTADYTFGYIAGWSSGRELVELKESLVAIRSASAAMIRDIDHQLELLQSNERGMDNPAVSEDRTEDIRMGGRDNSPGGGKEENQTVTYRRHRGH